MFHSRKKLTFLQDIFVQKSPLVTHVMSRIIKKILPYMSLRFLHLHFVFADILSNLLTLVSPFFEDLTPWEAFRHFEFIHRYVDRRKKRCIFSYALKKILFTLED